MQHVRLITFDIFGTLLDWQSYVEEAFPGRYDAFLKASAIRQMPGPDFMNYRHLLHDVALSLTPRASEQSLDFFADGMGFAKPFADSRAVQHLSRMAMIGVVSNSDYRHLVDVQKTLGVAFDVSVLAEELRAYKPHDAAWDLVYDTVTRKLGFDVKHWLHVAAYTDFDLLPAKERGIRTCFIPRPGGSPATEAESLPADLICSDLWQLAAKIAELNGAPVRYEVTAKTDTEATAADFVNWMRYEHGPELLEIRSCQQFQVVRLGPCEVRCEYVFSTEQALEEYIAGPAVELRKKGRARYTEAQVAFSRQVGGFGPGYSQRRRTDFMPKPRVGAPQ